MTAYNTARYDSSRHSTVEEEEGTLYSSSLSASETETPWVPPTPTDAPNTTVTTIATASTSSALYNKTGGSVPSSLSSPSLSSSSWQQEAQLLLELAGPTCFISLGGVLPGFLVASHIGRMYGSTYLDGYTLANLMGNLCTLSLLEGLYSASDTLLPQAYGAKNYHDVALLAIRGYIASLVVLAPINILLLLYFGKLMMIVGEDPVVSQIAHEWYRIYCLGYPFYALYKVTWKFLSAQHIMLPLLWNCIFCCGIILPFVLTIDTYLFGFMGTAYAVVMYLMAQSIVLLGYLKWKHPHKKETWPNEGLSLSLLRDAIQWKPFQLYVTLGIGGMLATSEWIYWEFASLLIGTMGVLPLSVHTVPTQVLMLGCMFPFGIGTALAVRLGIVLPRSVQRAKQLTLGSLLGSGILVGLITLWLYIDRVRIFSIFTSELDVLAGCEQIWWKVCILYLNLGLFGVNAGIATGLGMQWMFGTVSLICLWGVSLPGIYYFAIVQKGGLDTAYTWIFTPYIFMNLYLAFAFSSLDWHKIRRDIRIREGMDIHRDSDLAEGVVVIEEEELVQQQHVPLTTTTAATTRLSANGLLNETTTLLHSRATASHNESTTMV